MEQIDGKRKGNSQRDEGNLSFFVMEKIIIETTLFLMVIIVEIIYFVERLFKRLSF